MGRKVVTWVVAAGVGMTSMAFNGAARGQGFPNATDRVGGSETGGVGGAGAGRLQPQLILSETFEDNGKSPMWDVYAPEPDRGSVVEVNQHLELRANPGSSAVFAGYVSHARRFDPTADFSMKVDAHFSARGYGTGWLGFGLTPNEGEPATRHVSLGIGCLNGTAFYSYEKQEMTLVNSSRTQRFKDDVTLYISYDAAQDLLYLSDSGYGPHEAWMTVPGVLQGQWEGQPLRLVLGGVSEQLVIGPGQAFVDNLLVGTDTVIEPALQEVHRFWSPQNQRHFYTISELERDGLLTEHADVWTYEGVAYRAFRDDSDPACRPVYRFWSGLLSSHFYTIDEGEKAALENLYAGIWTYEGIAFYAYPAGQQPPASKPIYRFWSDNKGAHFYTISEDEKNRLLSKYSQVWAYEGIAWYAFE